MVKECGMHGLTDIIIATEGEAQIAHSATDMRSRKIFLDPLGSLDESHGIVVVFFHARGNGKNIGVENDIQRIETGLLSQQVV